MPTCKRIPVIKTLKHNQDQTARISQRWIPVSIRFSSVLPLVMGKNSQKSVEKEGKKGQSFQERGKGGEEMALFNDPAVTGDPRFSGGGWGHASVHSGFNGG